MNNQQKRTNIFDCFSSFASLRNRFPELLNPQNKYTKYFHKTTCQVWYLRWKAYAVVIPHLSLATIVTSYEEAVMIREKILQASVTDFLSTCSPKEG